MRIQVIVTKPTETSSINFSMATLLKEHIEKQNDMTLTSQAPDIIHVFGKWSAHTANLVTKINKRHIPSVFTSLDGLQPLAHNAYNRPSSISVAINMKRIITNTTIIHVCGPTEARLTAVLCPQEKIRVIPNPIITNIITSSDMSHNMSIIYKETIDSHEKTVREQISKQVKSISSRDKNIIDICCHILYIKYMLNRGGVPISLLNHLSQDMTTKQYDEEEMSGIINKLKISHFTSSLLSVLGQKSTLTEGFMPISATDDKLATRIINNIVNY